MSIHVRLDPKGVLVPSTRATVYVKSKKGVLGFTFENTGFSVEHWYENENSEETCDTLDKTYEELVEEINL